MARESTITYDQVATAADKIKAEGAKTTVRAIRELVGSGSMATILKFLQQWQGGQARQSQAIDDSLDPAIARAISNHLMAKIQASTAYANARLTDLQADVDTLIVEHERQTAEFESQAAAMAALQAQHAALAGRAQQLDSDATRTAADLSAERQAAEAARVELAKANLRLEAVPRLEADIQKMRTELMEARAQAAVLHEAGAVATAKLEAEIALRKNIEVQLTETVKQREDAMQRARASAEGAAELRGLLAAEKKPAKST